MKSNYYLKILFEVKENPLYFWSLDNTIFFLQTTSQMFDDFVGSWVGKLYIHCVYLGAQRWQSEYIEFEFTTLAGPRVY